MKKHPKPFITEIQAEGTHIERKLERAEASQLAHELIADMPPKGALRQSYIRNLTTRAMKKEVDPQAFEMFVELTNVRDEVDAVLARARMIAERKEI